jgi:hypothetical protein
MGEEDKESALGGVGECLVIPRRTFALLQQVPDAEAMDEDGVEVAF